MTNELISRQAAKDAFMKATADGDKVEFCWWVLDRVPNIDPVKHGEWIKNEDRYGWHCSACGEDDLYAFSWNHDKGEEEQQDRYCPNCGAKMEMEGEDETD